MSLTVGRAFLPSFLPRELFFTPAGSLLPDLSQNEDRDDRRQRQGRHVKRPVMTEKCHNVDPQLHQPRLYLLSECGSADVGSGGRRRGSEVGGVQCWEKSDEK